MSTNVLAEDRLPSGVLGLQLPDDKPVGEHSCKKNNRREFKTRNVRAVRCKKPTASGAMIPARFSAKFSAPVQIPPLPLVHTTEESRAGFRSQARRENHQ